MSAAPAGGGPLRPDLRQRILQRGGVPGPAAGVSPLSQMPFLAKVAFLTVCSNKLARHVLWATCTAASGLAQSMSHRCPPPPPVCCGPPHHGAARVRHAGPQPGRIPTGRGPNLRFPNSSLVPVPPFGLPQAGRRSSPCATAPPTAWTTRTTRHGTCRRGRSGVGTLANFEF